MGTPLGQASDLPQRGARARQVAGSGAGVRAGSYQVSGVGGAGALLGDAHAEAGQAAVGVADAQVEVVGPAAAAGEAFHLGLGGWTERWVQGARLGVLYLQPPMRPAFPAISDSSGSPCCPQAWAPSSCQLLPDLSPGPEQWRREGPSGERWQGRSNSLEGMGRGKAWQPLRLQGRAS